MANSSWSINVINDGADNFTATVFRNPTTAASGGTSLAGAGDSTVATATKLLPKKIYEALDVILNDRAAGN